MTPERLAEIRDILANWFRADTAKRYHAANGLLAELDAVTKERDLAETANSRLHSALVLAVKQRDELRLATRAAQAATKPANERQEKAK